MPVCLCVFAGVLFGAARGGGFRRCVLRLLAHTSTATPQETLSSSCVRAGFISGSAAMLLGGCVRDQRVLRGRFVLCEEEEMAGQVFAFCSTTATLGQ